MSQQRRQAVDAACQRLWPRQRCIDNPTSDRRRSLSQQQWCHRAFARAHRHWRSAHGGIGAVSRRIVQFQRASQWHVLAPRWRSGLAL